MTTLTNPRLPKGSEILVTGVTGYIGSWVVEEGLALGYKVKGAVRDIAKASWLQEHFDAKYPGQYSQIKLSAFSDKALLAEAFKGIAGIVHVAINTNLPTEAEPFVQIAIDEALAVLEVAQATESVKAVVLTSSSMASAPWGYSGAIGKDQYNDAFIKLAYEAPSDDPAKIWFVYAAAKAKAEQAAWKYYAENKPKYSLNQVLPAANFGPSVVYEKQGLPSTGGWPKALFDGDMSMIQYVPAQYFIDVRDDAKLHIGGLLDPEVNESRLFAFAEPYNWNVVLSHLRKIYPEHKLIDDLEGLATDTSTPPTEAALKVLKDVFGQDGWTKMETSLKDAGFDRK